MNRIAGRSRFVLILAAVLVLGLVIFSGEYLFQAKEWVVFPGSPHVYRGSNLNCGVVTDRTGAVLLDATDGRTYSDDRTVRLATLHLLGDREGYISAPAVSEYSSQMVGFDLINGVYSTSGTGGTAVLTISAKAQKAALEALDGRKPEYLIVSHMEPDHGANIAKLAALYPEMKVVGNAKTFQYMDQFFGPEAVAKDRRVTVKDGESLNLGSHTLTFVFAPMVHWPEVMVSYESSEKVLFSADGFGRFGAVAKFDEKADWASEARRYYLNIVGKYGPQVQALLKKAAALDIKTICPLHGPVLTGDLGKYLNYYDMWSSYKPEEPEKILVASASIHGHTRSAAHILAEKLRAKGAKVVEMDLTRTDVSYAVTEAFRCGKTVLACATYDGFLFPPMEALLTHLKTKNFQNRTVGLMENGTWAPMAAKLMRAELDGMKNMTVCDTVVTIRSAVNAAAEAQMDALADEIIRK